MNKLIENLDPKIWRQFVAIAKFKGMKAGELLNSVLFAFNEKQKIKGSIEGKL